MENMQAKAHQRYIRIAPRKMRLVVDAIRGKSVKDVEDLLRFIPKRSAEPISKVLKSARANAVNNFDMIEDNLIVKTVYVNEGPMLKRVIPRARGAANMLLKRTSHLTIVLEEIEEKSKKGQKRGK